jgi:hypothetical protein
MRDLHPRTVSHPWPKYLNENISTVFYEGLRRNSFDIEYRLYNEKPEL